MRLVVKVGTNSISKNGKLDVGYMKRLVNQIARLHAKGNSVMLISSGAIGAGIPELKLKAPLRKIEDKQAAAAVGQGVLMGVYKKLFDKHKITIAQVLLTYDVFSKRESFVNLKRTINHLLRMKVIPIMNENDTISINEIDKSFGDNDTLSAFVAAKTQADLLLMLTDTKGLYDKDPKRKGAKLLQTVHKITPEMEKRAGKAKLGGRGGMSSKVQAAKIAMKSGILMIIADSSIKDVVIRAVDGENIGTKFVPKESISNKKRWISITRPSGKIRIDEGAAKALSKGKSLLPAGIKKVLGTFSIGDVVEIVSSKPLGRVIIDYSSEELNLIKGKHTKDIASLLGYKGREEVFRRENFVGA